MAMVDQRAALEQLIRDRREDYAGLSRLIGRNAAYIQQFIKRGVPRKLDADDVRTLARYFRVSEAALGGRDAADPGSLPTAVQIPRLEVGASAGHGSLDGDEAARAHVVFDRRWLRQIGATASSDLSFIRVRGDSMDPTLSDGDDILVDRNDGADRLRDGIYVLRRDETLMVKRVAINPVAPAITIKSDNDAYPEWSDCPLSSVQILGRVVWAGRKVG